MADLPFSVYFFFVLLGATSISKRELKWFFFGVKSPLVLWVFDIKFPPLAFLQ